MSRNKITEYHDVNFPLGASLAEVAAEMATLIDQYGSDARLILDAGPNNICSEIKSQRDETDEEYAHRTQTAARARAIEKAKLEESLAIIQKKLKKFK